MTSRPRSTNRPGCSRVRQRVVYANHSPDTLTSFAFHLYLNAFRPGSRWADADSIERKRRFNDLKDPDYGFNHVRNVRIMGAPVEPIWPFAPDSTIVRYQLPGPLAPGDSMVVDLDWDARPSTVPRRQGRRGRRFDFAQWYPKVVVYDRHGWEEHPLYPGGEFYGEFASFLVDLDVPAGPGDGRDAVSRSAVIRVGSRPIRRRSGRWSISGTTTRVRRRIERRQRCLPTDGRTVRRSDGSRRAESASSGTPRTCTTSR